MHGKESTPILDKPVSLSTAQSALVLLAGTAVGVAVVGGLYWAQSVLIPIALAVLLAFLLTPVVKALQRWHLDRRLSIILVVLLAAALIGGVGWIVKVELSSLAEGLPTYSRNVRVKVQYIRDLGGRVGTERLASLLENFTGAAERTPPPSPAEEVPQPNRPNPNAAPAPPDEPAAPAASNAWQSRLLNLLGAVMSSAAGIVLALVLVIFLLLEREPLRNRLIRLMGYGHVSATTKALDDAGGRIGRYLHMQFALNSSYGILWGTALYFIGVDYALLWGFLAAVLRYIPYLGASLGALFPIALSLAQFPGWWSTLIVIAVVLVLELVWNNALEPWLYGQSIGVSPVGMLIAVAFWTLLWGPVGLVLSGPLTICLVVLGTHVPGLAFFSILLGDAPAVKPGESFYLQLVSRNQDEAAQLILEQANTLSPTNVYDDLLVPALIRARRDLERQELSAHDCELVLRATRELLDDLGEHLPRPEAAATLDPDAGAPSPASPPVHVFLSPARDQADVLAMEMLRQLLDPQRWDLNMAASDTSTTSFVDLVAREAPALVCMAAMPPGGLAHARYLCKRLRLRCPKVKILVGRWGLDENLEINRAQLLDAGADAMATTLGDTCRQLEVWLANTQFDTPDATASPAPHYTNLLTSKGD